MKTLDRIMTGNLNRDEYPKFLQDYISDNDLGKLHDLILKPALKGLTNAADRSSQQVFDKSELDDLLSNSDGLVEPFNPTPVGASVEDVNAGGYGEHLWHKNLMENRAQNRIIATSVPGRTKKNDKTVDVGRLGKFVDFLKKHKTAIGVSAAGATAIAAAIAASIAIARSKRKNKGKKKNDGTEKRAYFGEAIVDAFTDPVGTTLVQGARIHPLGAMIYDTATAEKPKDYRAVNERLARWFNTNQGINGGIPYTFDSPSWRPGDNVLPIVPGDDNGRTSPSLAAQRTWDTFARPRYERDEKGEYVIDGDNMIKIRERPDIRLAPLAELAAGLLPNQNYMFSSDVEKYPIGMQNLAYMAPFAIGQYAEDLGMKDEDIARLYKEDGAGLTSRALAQQINKYPLVRNVLSAYVNGGFGRTDDPKSYGLADGWWDYAAQAMTPAGTNAVDKVVNEIVDKGLPYNYDYKDKNDRDVIADRVRNQLRGAMLQTADTLGPRVLKPNTYLGKEFLIHPDAGVYGTIDKIIPIAKGYYDKDTNIVHRMMRTLPRATVTRLKELKAKGERFAKQVEQKANDAVTENAGR